MSYYFFLFLALFKYHTINLDFKPAGQVVRLHYRNVIIYTDTVALFSVYNEYGDMPAYDTQVVRLIRRKIYDDKKDTVSFSGDFILFDSLNKKQWAVGWAVTHLVNDNKLMVFDKNNNLVEKVVVKAAGRKRNHWASVRLVYINSATKEELFSEGRYLSRGDPKFR